MDRRLQENNLLTNQTDAYISVGLVFVLDSIHFTHIIGRAFI